jgi:hypothetical protein
MPAGLPAPSDLMSDEDFDNTLVNITTEFFDDVTQAQYDGVSPTLFVYGLSQKGTETINTKAVIELGPTFIEEKQDILFNIGTKLLNEVGIVPLAVFIISEAYMTNLETEDKIEAVVIAGRRIDGLSNMVTLKVGRDSDNNMLLSDAQYVMSSDSSKADSPLLARVFVGVATSVMKGVSPN